MQAAPRLKASNMLPDTMELTVEEFKDIYPTWLQWRATDRRFLPTELRGQPQFLLDGLLYIDGIFEKIVSQIIDQDTKK